MTARLVRAIKRERPLTNAKRRLLLSFPWEIGYLRFLWLTRLGRKPTREYKAPDRATKELDYSASYLEHYRPDRRVQWTMFLLASIPDCKKDSLLVIGPRYEPELLMAQGLGWDSAGIRGIDTYSYSPRVDVGDMHRLPYPDKSFSSIICGWTLTYSDHPGRATEEMQRVVAPGGYVIVAVQKTPEGYQETLDVLAGADRIQTLEQLDRLFSGMTRVAGFEPDVQPGAEGHTIAAYRKPAAA